MGRRLGRGAKGEYARGGVRQMDAASACRGEGVDSVRDFGVRVSATATAMDVFHLCPLRDGGGSP